ncbi:hypothetical protein [Actinomadura violacea]|uniref:hypothetical protein n=1 Tax=Actinomadura violacea TaxID=2819934 RepID=UPI0027DB7573|nr:hypothetical protein [Actinomadura violacea]
MNDVPQEPEPDDRPEDAERESGRTATAEFRIPAPAPAKNASLTRPDIRRPAKPAEDPADDESAPEEDPPAEAESEDAGADAETAADESTEAPEEEPKTDVAEEIAETDEDAPADDEESEADDPSPAPAPPEDAEDAEDEPDTEPDDLEPADLEHDEPEHEEPEHDEPEPEPDHEHPAAAEEDEEPEAEPLPEPRPEVRPEPPAGDSPAEVTRIERLPSTWQTPEPPAAQRAPEPPAAPPAPERTVAEPPAARHGSGPAAVQHPPAPPTAPQEAVGEEVWWNSPRQSSPPTGWETPRQPPVGEFRPESVRWDAGQGAAPPAAPRQSGPWEVAAPQPPAAPRQSGPWEVATPHQQAQAPYAHAPQPPGPVEPAGEEVRRPKRRRLVIVLVAALVLVVGVVAGQLIRPVPDPTVKLTLASSHVFQGAAPALPWPAAGQSAVYVDGLGTMGASGGSAPTPTASVAKVMTAFVYLRDHPLKTGQPGPVLAVSPQGVAEIPARKKRGESLLGITAGQRLTERKALEALLIISANDLAHELARWDSGGDQPFVAKMNATARELGMTSTHYTDPSGYDKGTVSTAADQVKLLRAAMKVQAFTEIVNRRAYVPDDGSPARPGGNVLVGQYGVVGGKTGYTDAAGGNFVFAARKRVGGVPTLILGAVMGQKSPSAQGAVQAAAQLIQAAENAMTAATLAPKGGGVGRVDDGLGGTTPLRAGAPVTVVGWPGLRVQVGVRADPPHQGDAGQQVGQVTAGAAKVPLVLGSALDEPSYLKRLIRLN